MGHGPENVDQPAVRERQRSRNMIRIYTVMMCLTVIILLQLMLLNIAVEGFLGDEPEVLWAATGASGVCCVVTLFLIRAVGRSLR